jgi:hypothetical protein
MSPKVAAALLARALADTLCPPEQRDPGTAHLGAALVTPVAAGALELLAAAGYHLTKEHPSCPLSAST